MYRVLFYAPTVGRGGVHLVVHKLTHALAQAARDTGKWQFDVLGQTYDEIGIPIEWPEDWPFTQIDPVSRLPDHPHQFHFLRLHANTFYNHLARMGDNYDLIYCPSPWWTMRVREWRLDTPFVCTVPDFAFDFIDMGLLTSDFRHVSQLIAKQVNFTVFPSDFSRLHGERYYGFKNTRTIYHSADFVADGYEPSGQEAIRVREKYGLPERYVLAFHCAYHKDPVTILRAQLYARSNSPLVPVLVMAGIGTEHFLPTGWSDPHIEHVRETIKNIQARPGVDLFILGRIPDEDIAGLHVGATCAVTASTSEGDLSGSIFAAFKARTPMIYSSLPVFLERLGIDERYGLSFPIRDHVALGRQIIEISENPDAARQRALEAYGFANQREVRDVAREYLDVFEQVIKEKLRGIKTATDA